MARIRTIKPEFWKHEDLSELPPETHMLAASLLNYADDEGYFNANPKLVQAECSPLREDSTNVRRSIELLSSIGYIRLFDGSDGKSYGHITTFNTHQRVDRPKPSKIKLLEVSTKDRRKIDDESTQEGNREQGTGNREGNTNGSSGKPDKPSLIDQQFESVWQAYPKREGSNPKNKAKSAFKARIKDGADPALIAQGVSRYRKFCEAKGSIGTEYVMQAQRFFGPGKEYENDWLITEASNAKHQPGGNKPLSRSEQSEAAFHAYIAELDSEDEESFGGGMGGLAEPPPGSFPGGQH